MLGGSLLRSSVFAGIRTFGKYDMLGLARQRSVIPYSFYIVRRRCNICCVVLPLGRRRSNRNHSWTSWAAEGLWQHVHLVCFWLVWARKVRFSYLVCRVRTWQGFACG